MNEAVSFIRRRAALAFGIFVFVFALPAFADDDLIFDFGSAHKFLGLGVQLWPGTDHQEERDALLRDLRVKYIRVGFTTKLPDEQLKDHMSVNEILSAITRSEDDGQRSIFSQFHAELAQLHVTAHFVFWQVPSVWCINTEGIDGNRQRVSPDHIQDYANWIVANLLYAKRFHLLPVAVEMINEPDGATTTQFTPEQYDALLVTLRWTLDGRGLNSIGIEGPGVSTASTVEAYAQVLERTGHISLLNQISWHDYDTAKRPEPAGFAGIPLDLLAHAHGLPITITEFNSQSPQWDRLPYDSGPRTRGPNNAADSPDFAVSVAGEALKLIADGANSLFYWQAEDPSFTQDAFGLLNTDGQRKPAASALQMFSGLAQPNSDVTGPQHVSFGLSAVCFRSERGLLFVGANLSTTLRRINAQILNVPAPARIASGRRFDAHGLNPLKNPASAAALDGSAISLELPARSVIALLLR